MHEIGIVRQIVRTVTDFAQENGIDEIAEVVVDCGELSLVIPKYLQDTAPPAAALKKPSSRGRISASAKSTSRRTPERKRRVFSLWQRKERFWICRR